MFFIENCQFGRQDSLRGDIQCGQPLEQVSMSQAPALARVAFADAPLAEFLPRLALGDVGRCEGLIKRLAFIQSSMCEIIQIGSPAMGEMRGGEGIVKNPFELHRDNPLLLNRRCDNTPRDRAGDCNPRPRCIEAALCPRFFNVRLYARSFCLSASPSRSTKLSTRASNMSTMSTAVRMAGKIPTRWIGAGLTLPVTCARRYL